MDKQAQTIVANLKSEDSEVRYQAFLDFQELTNEKVDWAYEVWDGFVAELTHKDNHLRSRAAQFLCNLAKSDPDGRIFRDFPALMEMTRDEKFVTARHSLQSLWKIGLAGAKQKEMVLQGLAERYRNCVGEKNYTLIRYDIIEDFRKLYNEDKDESIRQLAADLIEAEEDPKYRKKYAAVWKK